MDTIDNPDHGHSLYNGIKVVNNSFNPAKAVTISSTPPEGGPVFPAMEDVQISSTPT